jgi:hypothetical protein
MTNDNQPLVDALSAPPPTKFGFATDVLCLSIGCDVRLVENINVSAGFGELGKWKSGQNQLSSSLFINDLQIPKETFRLASSIIV